MSTSLIIHGGAGRIDDAAKYQAALLAILDAGRNMLKEGRSALSVVEACVNMLEDDPLFNAARGSVLDAEGNVEMDASIMDGKTFRAGAVAGVHNIKNPVSLARLVLEKSPHVLLAGNGAQEFAIEHSVKLEDDAYFITEARIRQLELAKKESRIGLDHDASEKKLGTVGTVAYDRGGNIAAATSTGGLVNKRFGRIGDTPIVGAGVYADNDSCGVSCTGIGEDILRVSLANHIALSLSNTDMDATTAAKEAIVYLKQKLNGQAGVIVIDKKGRLGVDCSTPAVLAVGYENDGEAQSFFTS